MTKTLLLGLDGLDPGLVEKWDLPNIESIGEGFEISTHGNSGPSWVSVLTGLRPKEHGVHKLEPQQDSQSWQGTPIWEKIDGYSGVANVPLTYPARKHDIDGWLVSGLMTPRKTIFTNPPGLTKDLMEMGYRIDVWVDEHQNHPHGHFGTVPFEFSQEYREELLTELQSVMVERAYCFEWLIENHPVDFAFLCFTSLDRVQHLAMDDLGEIRFFYQFQDEMVGKILDSNAVDEDTEIFVTSDHGFQEIDIPDTDIKGEHRSEGFGATNTTLKFQDLEQLHENVVQSANRDGGVEGRLSDLGYI